MPKISQKKENGVEVEEKKENKLKESDVIIEKKLEKINEKKEEENSDSDLD